MTVAYRPTLYTASKLWHAALWQLLRDEHPEIEFTSRWIDSCTPEIELQSGPAEFAHFWTIDIQDVQRSDFTLLFAAEEKEAALLQGGVFEAGAAIGANKIVLLVGKFPRHNWQHHPRVVRFDFVAEAFKFLERYSVTVKTIESNFSQEEYNTTLDRG